MQWKRLNGRCLLGNGTRRRCPHDLEEACRHLERVEQSDIVDLEQMTRRFDDMMGVTKAWTRPLRRRRELHGQRILHVGLQTAGHKANPEKLIVVRTAPF